MDELSAYYENLVLEYGYDSLCRMRVPENLAGMTVLDVCCRRGKGVFKLSDRVGAAGLAIGVDWNPAYIDCARSKEPSALVKNGLDTSNMRFATAYPERLADSVSPASVDMAYINGVLHLCFDPALVLASIHAVLKPGGKIIAEVPIAEGPQDALTIAEARRLRNCIQAAPTQGDLARAIEAAGFRIISDDLIGSLDPSWDYEEQPVWPTVPAEEANAAGKQEFALHLITATR